jgi:hypothetical protein
MICKTVTNINGKTPEDWKNMKNMLKTEINELTFIEFFGQYNAFMNANT